jgi:predicted TIM-barrel fold metal-dependent hydrolase
MDDGLSAHEAIVIVSSDGHVAPVVERYRPFCEAQYLDELDDFIAKIDDHLLSVTGTADRADPRRDEYLADLRVRYGSQDLYENPDLRLSHMDDDGVAIEIVYHGGFNGQPIPFFSRDLMAHLGQDVPAPGRATELRAAGIRMYNRWLADYVSVAPERLIGLAHIPMWDVASSVEEVKLAHSAGLRGINLPAPRRGLTGYNDESWRPLWRICSDLGMSLHTHGGAGERLDSPGTGYLAIRMTEEYFAARRALPQLIFGAVFELYPDLKFFVTEQTGRWIPETLNEFEAIYHAPHHARAIPYIRDYLPHEPNFYFRRNCFVGASFMAHYEAESAVEHGYWMNMLWGRDYPHPEGTWPFTRASIRATFSGIPEGPVRAMLGESALDVLDINRAAARAIADRIGPSYADTQVPLEQRPAGSEYSLGFRQVGSFA